MLDKASYLVYKKEIGTQANKLHFQGMFKFLTKAVVTNAHTHTHACLRIIYPLGYVYFPVQVTTTALSKRYGSGYCFRPEVKGPQFAIDYVKKLATTAGDIHEHGSAPTPPEKGSHKIWMDMKDALRQGKSLAELRSHPKFYNMMMRYPRYWQSLQDDFLQEKILNRGEPQLHVIYGKTGAGKSYWLRQKYLTDGLPPYEVKASSSGTTWFDEYQGQEAILFDEFYGQYPLHDLLTLCDGKTRVQVKGSHTTVWAKHILFTSNEHPMQWWRNMPWHLRAPFNRRLIERGNLLFVDNDAEVHKEYIDLRREGEKFEELPTVTRVFEPNEDSFTYKMRLTVGLQWNKFLTHVKINGSVRKRVQDVNDKLMPPPKKRKVTTFADLSASGQMFDDVQPPRESTVIHLIE